MEQDYDICECGSLRIDMVHKSVKECDEGQYPENCPSPENHHLFSPKEKKHAAAFEMSFQGLLCQEVTNSMGQILVFCHRPAVMIVFHDREKKSYAFCHPCGTHNVRNRGGQMIQQNLG